MASLTITHRSRSTSAGSGVRATALRVRRHPATWLSVICSLPVLIAAYRTISGGWMPEGDDARVATRIRAVLTGNPPLLGMRSTSGSGNRALDSHHPGPLQFYLDAPVSALFHYSAAGIVLSVVIVNVACVIGTVAMAHRMRGLRTAVPVSGALLLAEWQLGTDPLSHPLNPYAGILPLFLMLVAAWAVLDRDRHGPWVMVLSGSFAAQANLAFCPLVLAVCGTALLVCGGRVWRNFRHGYTGRSWRNRAAARRRALVTTALAVLAWLPPIVELFTLHPNNLQLVARFATTKHPNGQPVLGLPTGSGFVVGHLSPSMLARFGPFMNTTPSRTAIGVGLVALLLLFAAATMGPQLPRTAAARGSWLLLVAIAGESVAMSRMELATQRAYWELPVLIITPLAYAMLVVRGVELLRPAALPHRLSALVRRVSPTRLPATTVALGVAAALAASVTAGAPSLSASRQSRAVTNSVLGYLHAHGKPGAPVAIVSDGLASWITVSPAIAFQLLRDGYPAHFEIDWSYPEDINTWNLSTAPPGSVIVTLADASAASTVKLPEGAVPIPVPPADTRGIHLWISLPTARK